MAINKALLDRLDSLVDSACSEYEEVLRKSAGQLSSIESTIGPASQDGDPLTPQDGKGGLSGAAAPAPPMEKAVPPGFTADQKDDSEGPEDEADEKDGDEGEDAEPKEADEASDNDGDGIEDEGDADDEEAGDGDSEGDRDGRDEGDEDEDDGDPEFEAKFEKSFYKFMEKHGMGGDQVAKSEVEPEGEVLAKAFDEKLVKITSSVDEKLSKMEAMLAKALGAINKIANAPAAARKSVTGVSPVLRKSEDGVEAQAKPTLTKSQVTDRLLALQKSGDPRISRTIVAAVESARSNEEVARLVAGLGIA